MATNPYQTYQNNAVNTASPGDLTLMLYNGCLKFIKQAKVAIENKDVETKHINLVKAQNIITELMITLDTDYEVGKSMMQMYDYMKRRLIEANTNNDVEILHEVEGYVIEFRDTWKEVIRITRQQKYAVGGQV